LGGPKPHFSLDFCFVMADNRCYLKKDEQKVTLEKKTELPVLLLKGLIEEFIDSLRWSNCSTETQNSYRKDLTLFLNHLPTPESFQVDQLTAEVLES
jgi:hypothetical protein